MFQITRRTDADLDHLAEVSLRALLFDAFEGDFSQEDWEHTNGGLRFLGYLGAELVAHGSVIKRNVRIDEEDLKIGYVEGLAVAPLYWRRGFGSKLMSEITSYCKTEFRICMLSTGEKDFYRKLGWLDFEGESYVFRNGVEVRTADEDEGLMYLPGSVNSPTMTKVVCEAREGDDW
ncbi:MAG: GNAT family N-acetyltransferase [Actinomycetota bacterium]